jgi:hypothetical protein
VNAAAAAAIYSFIHLQWKEVGNYCQDVTGRIDNAAILAWKTDPEAADESVSPALPCPALPCSPLLSMTASPQFCPFQLARLDHACADW